MLDTPAKRNFHWFWLFYVACGVVSSCGCFPLIEITFPKTNIAPENQWLEDEISFWDGLFWGRFREHISVLFIFTPFGLEVSERLQFTQSF